MLNKVHLWRSYLKTQYFSSSMETKKERFLCLFPWFIWSSSFTSGIFFHHVNWITGCKSRPKGFTTWTLEEERDQMSMRKKRLMRRRDKIQNDDDKIVVPSSFLYWIYPSHSISLYLPPLLQTSILYWDQFNHIFHDYLSCILPSMISSDSKWRNQIWSECLKTCKSCQISNQ